MVGRMGSRLQVQPMLESLWFGQGDSSEEGWQSSDSRCVFFFLILIFIQFLKVTFHLQLLQISGCIRCVVQHILEPVLHLTFCSPTPLHCIARTPDVLS